MGNEQTTLRGAVSVTGIGVHSGEPVTATLNPAPAGAGLKFRRTGLAGGASRTIPAHVDHVGSTELCTVLGDDGRGVATVEHLLASLRGLGVDNALVTLDGPEAPILDGSAARFVAAIESVGIAALPAPRRYLKVLKPIAVRSGSSWAELLPHDRGLRVEIEIDFSSSAIGRQSIALDVTPRTFKRELMGARTFGFLHEVEKLRPLGFARGSSLDNTVVVDGERVLNADGLRAPDEFVRHKALDTIGDLALAGLPILGCFRSHRGGHRLNVAAIRALLRDRTAWTVFTASARLRKSHTELVPALHAAYAPEIH